MTPIDAPDLGLGLGWRPQTAGLVLSRGDLGFTEVIAESLPRRRNRPLPLLLQGARQQGTSVVVHGVGLSLGGTEQVDRRRVRHLARLAERLDAPLVSEHAAFVRAGGREAGHLLPVPHTREALDVLVRNVRVAQDQLPVPLAIEQPASLFAWPDAEMDEADFLTELVSRTGCGLVLDLANLHVNARNHGFEAMAVLERLPLEAIRYVHAAGGIQRGALLHDTHAHPVWPAVTDLVTELAPRIHVPGILLERDDLFPPDEELNDELDRIAVAWAAGENRRSGAGNRTSTARRNTSTPETGSSGVDRRSLRSLAKAQTAVVRALIDGGSDPLGLDSTTLAATRGALADKRARGHAVMPAGWRATRRRLS